jgi:hypothetical protein
MCQEGPAAGRALGAGRCRRPGTLWPRPCQPPARCAKHAVVQ